MKIFILQLRDRLLRELEVVHTPSEAFQAIEKSDKKTQPLGPHTPEWVTNRPFLSLAFTKTDPPREIAPLGKFSDIGIRLLSVKMIL